MSPTDKPLGWLRREIKTPPFSAEARLEAGYLPRRLQHGDKLEMPESRPMPSIGARVHELSVTGGKTEREWRIVYRVDDDAIVIADVFPKTTQKTPKAVIANCQRRLRDYDS